MEYEALIRPELREIEPYTPIVPFEVLAERLGLPAEQIVKLDANENPYGPAPRVAAALASYPHLAIYPDPGQERLRAAVSGYIGQPAERIICGNGSDEIIDLIMRLVVGPGDAIIECPPTFGMYSFNAGVVAGRAVPVWRTADFAIDVAGVAAAVREHGAKAIFLPSPNNPTGTVVPRTEVVRLLELPALLVIDEAYAEFSGESVADLVGQHDNLVVLRTFSKWAGLAGLRVGYGLLPAWLAAHVWKIKPPYNINVAAEVAVLASLEELPLLAERLATIVAERGRVMAALHELPGVAPCPSEANFILFRLTDADAGQVKQALDRRGVLLRYYNKRGLANYLRISIGTPAQNDRALSALREVLAG